MRLIINTDGGGQASTDVGGDAAAAYVVQTEEGYYLGSKSMRLLGTNNDAEYSGVLLAMQDLFLGEIADWKDIESVTFIADSQLVVYHLTGDWKCKSPTLRVHRDRIRAIGKSLPFPVAFTWNRREFNKNADTLCAAAMEHGPKTIFTDPIPPDPRKEGPSGTTLTKRRSVKDAFAIEPVEPSEYWIS
jgi:ribonuclease HI